MRDACSSWMFRRIGNIAANVHAAAGCRESQSGRFPSRTARPGSALRRPARSCEARPMSDPVESFQRDGYTILERAIDRSFCAELSAALAPLETGRPMGRNAFEGLRSHRVYSLAGKGEPFRRLAEQPDV